MKFTICLLVCLVLLLGSADCNPPAPTKLGPTSPAAGVWQNLSGSNEVIDLLVDGDKVWAATSDGVVCWNLTDGSRQKYTAREGLAGNTVREVVKDTNGNIWVSCYVDGVSCFDGKTWQTFTVENGLVSNDVITLAPDNSGGVWVSGYWGVSYFDGKDWASYSDADPNSMVTGGDNPMKECKNLTHIDAPLSAVDVILIDSHDNIWFSSRSDGVTRYKNGEWTVFTEEDGIGKGGARPYLEDAAGNIWAGCMGDISRFNGEKWETFHFSDQIPRPYVQNVVQDSRGDIWITAYENIAARYDGIEWHNYTAADGLPADNVRLLFKDKNGVLYAAAGNCVSRLYDGIWQPMKDMRGVTGEIRAVDIDDSGNLWFGTADGVSYYSVKDEASNPALSIDDEAEIYAAVIRQVVTVDDTFGGKLKPPVLYLIRNTDDNAGNPTGGSSASVIISRAMQGEITDSLDDLTGKIVWIDKLEDAEFEDSEMQLKSVKKGGAIITLGNIHLQDDGTVQLAGSIYIAPLAAGGMTYILEKEDGTWTITGNTGRMWIS